MESPGRMFASLKMNFKTGALFRPNGMTQICYATPLVVVKAMQSSVCGAMDICQYPVFRTCVLNVFAVLKSSIALLMVGWIIPLAAVTLFNELGGAFHPCYTRSPPLSCGGRCWARLFVFFLRHLWSIVHTDLQNLLKLGCEATIQCWHFRCYLVIVGTLFIQ